MRIPDSGEEFFSVIAIQGQKLFHAKTNKGSSKGASKEERITEIDSSEAYTLKKMQP